MTELKYMNAKVDEMLSKLDAFVTLIQGTLADTGFSLEDRWELYLKTEKLLPFKRYISKSIRILSPDNVYEDWFPDGRGSLYNSSVDESLHEGIYDEYEGYDPEDEYAIRGREQFAKRDEWREAVLAEGVGGFIFDW